MNLRMTVLRAVTYNTLAVVLVQAISLCRSVLLARLLTPGDLGLFGMAVLAVSAGETLLNLQLAVTLIPQDLGDEQRQKRWLDTVWSVELLRSLLVFLLVLAASVPVTRYFGEPRLLGILVVTSLGTLVSALGNVGMTLHQKAVDFRPLALWETLTAIFNLVVTVALAYAWGSADALAWGAVLAASFRILLSYSFHPYRPHWGIDGALLRQGLRMGVSLLIVGILTYLTTQLDIVAVGRQLGSTILGFYLVAYAPAMLPVQFIGGVVSRTLFPALAKVLRDDRDRAFSLWMLSLRYTGWLGLMIAVPLWVERDRLIPWLYGAKWGPAVAPFAILIFAGLLRGLTYASSSMINALGKPEMDARAKIAEAVLFLFLLLTLVKPLGMAGAAWAGVACHALAFLARTLYVATRRPGLLLQALSLVPRLAAGFAAGALCGGLARSLGAPLLASLPLTAVLMLPCALLLEGDVTGPLLGIGGQFLKAREA